MNPIRWALGALLSVLASNAFADTVLSTFPPTYQFSASVFTGADHMAPYNLGTSASIDTRPHGTLAGVWGITGYAYVDTFADTLRAPYNWTHVATKSSASNLTLPRTPVDEQWQYSTSHAGGGGTSQYYIEIVGPAGLVPLNVQGSLWTAASAPDPTAVFAGNATADASISLLQVYDGNLFGSPNYEAKAAVGYPSIPNSDYVNIDATLQWHANQPILVSLYTAASADTQCSYQNPGLDINLVCEGPATADSRADPYFSIPSTFANAGQYQLEFSPGVGNVPGAPEPSTWAMMLLGFGGLAFAGHRRIRKNAPALAEA